MNSTESSIDALIAKVDQLTENEEGQLVGGVCSVEIEMDKQPTAPTNYFQCSCNNYCK